MRITWVGHSTAQIEDGGTRLLTDPVLLPRVAHLRRIAAAPRLADLRRPDAVLISHAHLDHLDPRSLRELAPCPVLAPQGCRRLLERAGLREVIEPAPGERVEIGSVSVTPALLDHNGRRHPFSRARETLAYLVEGERSAFFAGDTDVFEGMRAWAGVDVALLPIWGWGPRVGRGHMDPGRAAEAAALLEPRVAIPIHWGTLASPRAPWVGDPGRPARAFRTEMERRAPHVDVRILAPGEATEIAAPGVS
ncbi:MAG: MBL fold metallo-hydrolase [Thermoleophilaceae bacterium]|nr:MBL fold metallo-hydrolase [Thermoleophilaceae bacterium]